MLALRQFLFAAVLTLAVVDSLTIAQASAETTPPILTATAGQGGQVDACTSSEHANANPSSTDSAGPVHLGGDCQTGSPEPSAATQSGTQGQTSRTAGSANRNSAVGASTATTTKSVSAADARGLQITRVTAVALGTGVRRTLRVTVVLRDAEWRLIRGAIVTVGPLAAAKRTISGSGATYTNLAGKALIRIPLTADQLGGRVSVRIDARTPSAHALAIATPRLPRRPALAGTQVM